MQHYRQLGIALNEARVNSLGLPHDLYLVEAFHDLFPHYSQLHLCEPVTHTTVQTKPE